MAKARKYTTITQLHADLNNDIIEYFDETVGIYSVVFRQTFHKIKNNPDINFSKLNTEIQKEYKVTKRTANSIIRDAISLFNLLIYYYYKGENYGKKIILTKTIRTISN